MNCIYKITNTYNGKVYIGKTNNFNKRIKRHFTNYAIKNEPTKILYRSILKYGREKFVAEVIEDNISDEDVSLKEIEYISKYNSLKPYGYNMTIGGEGVVGLPCSNKTRKAISKGNKGKKLSDEHKKLISERHKGKVLSDEHKLKISSSNKGRKDTYQTRVKKSKGQKQRVVSCDTRLKQKLSIRNKYSKNNTQKYEFVSINDNNIFVGTYYEFKDYTGIIPYTITEGKNRLCFGWFCTCLI